MSMFEVYPDVSPMKYVWSITNETPSVQVSNYPSIQVSNYPSVPQTVHQTEGSGAHHSATMPSPTVVWSGDPTHPPLMYWGRGREMTWIPLNVDLGDFLQIVGITVVIPSWVNVAFPVWAQAAIVGFSCCRHFFIILLQLSCNKMHSFISVKSTS